MKTKLLILLFALLGVSSSAMANDVPTWQVTDNFISNTLSAYITFKDGQTSLGPGYIFVFAGSECRMGSRDNANYSDNSTFAMSIAQTETEGLEDTLYTLYYFRKIAEGDYKMYIAEIHRSDCVTGSYIIPAYITIDISNLPAINVPINITEAKWATITLPFDVTLTASSVTAYTCESHEEGKLTLTEVQKSGDDLTLTACTPYLLYSETTFSQTVNGVPQELSDYVFTEGLLTGNVMPVKLQGGDYGLQNLNDKVAFYPIASGATATLPANRVYIKKESATGARGFFLDDEETAIETLTGTTDHTRDGKYIENGRFVLIKNGMKYSTTGIQIND